MNPDYFLFGLGIVWAAFASVQDVKTREVSNWLNFSLVFFGLFYRLAVWFISGNEQYFINGLVSFAIFFFLSYIFYYSSVFAGGDAKLLMGLGAIIPGAGIVDTIFNGFLFIMLLLLVGAVWSIIALFTPFVPITRKNFTREFIKRRKQYVYLIPAFIIISGASFFVLFKTAAIAFSILAALAILGYPALKAVEKCMIIRVHPSRLTEGDWIINDIRVGKIMIAKTVNGLSRQDIVLLKKAGRKVTIKTGVPFSPAFLITLLLTVSFWVSDTSLSEQVSRLLFP